ncbi:hypothetical protein HON22_02430, partial [Candidatus Peregrinibacteria bacterium]|nr:hypothetical protein [Candidatus Peregrinibacteria bacterium]
DDENQPSFAHRSKEGLEEPASFFNMEVLEIMEMMSHSFFESLLNEKPGRMEILEDGTQRIELFEGVFLRVSPEIQNEIEELKKIETHEDFEAMTIGQTENGDLKTCLLDSSLRPREQDILHFHKAGNEMEENKEIKYFQNPCSPESELIRILEIDDINERLSHFEYLWGLGVIHVIDKELLRSLYPLLVKEDKSQESSKELQIIQDNKMLLKKILTKNWVKYAAKQSVKQSRRVEESLERNNVENYFYMHNHPVLYYEMSLKDVRQHTLGEVNTYEKFKRFISKNRAVRRIIYGSDLNHSKLIKIQNLEFRLLGIIVDAHGYSINIAYKNDKEEMVFKVIHIEKEDPSSKEKCCVSQLPYNEYLFNAYQAKMKGILRGIDYLSKEWYSAVCEGCIEPIIDMLNDIEKELDYMAFLGRINSKSVDTADIRKRIGFLLNFFTYIGNPHFLSGKAESIIDRYFKSLKVKLKDFIKKY